MQPYQQRVVEEKDELDAKIAKLQAFFSTETFKALPSEEQERMKRQFAHMGSYSAVLWERIGNFK